MTTLNTLSSAIELRMAVTIMLGLLATLALFALSRLSVVKDESATISGNWLPGVRYAGAMDTDISDYRIGLLQYIAAVEPAQTAVAAKNMADAQANFKKDSAQFAKLIKSEKERALFDKFNGAFTRYQAAAQSVAALALMSLINDSVERVQNGTVLLDRAGQTFQNIVGSVQRLADRVGEISSASRKQSAGIGQVGEAVTLLDQATQQNAALVEESAAASESLKVQAQNLLNAVAGFKPNSNGNSNSNSNKPSTPRARPHSSTLQRRWPTVKAPSH